MNGSTGQRIIGKILKFLIHIGSPKAGSSYLKTLSALLDWAAAEEGWTIASVCKMPVGPFLKADAILCRYLVRRKTISVDL